MEPERQESPEWLEHAERARAWFDCPDKSKKRTAAKQVLRKRVGEIVEPLGFRFTERGIGWEMKKRFVTRGIYLQPSKSGDRCYFNLAKVPNNRFIGVREVKRLGHFYEAGYDRVGEPGSLFYYDIELLPRYVEHAMEVMEKQAIPWLLK